MPPLPSRARLSESESVIILATSGRAFAQACRTSSITPFVIDLCGDDDMKQSAERSIRLSKFTKEHLQKALDQLDPQEQLPLIYGSPFERYGQWLCDIRGKRPIWGTEPHQLIKLAHPQHFFKILDNHAIPYPRTQFMPPADDEKWLIKDSHSSGGLGIRLYHEKHDAALTPHHYYQKFMQGEAWGLFFLARGTDILPIGYSRMITENAPPFPFRLHALLEAPPSCISASNRARIESWARLMTISYELRGLCSLDVLIQNDDAFLLEVNPRGGHALDIHALNTPLIAHHRAACHLDKTNFPIQKNKKSHGMMIIYASHARFILKDYSMPFIKDRPSKGQFMQKGEPICTIHACADACPYDKLKKFLDLLSKDCMV